MPEHDANEIPERESTSPTRDADRIYEAVKTMAATYEIRPGDRINESEFARRLAVSRTPLREALNRLEAEGFVVAKANRGYFVRSLEASEVFDLYEYRCELEAAAVRFACERASRPDLDDLEQFVLASKDEKDDQLAIKFLRLDEEFHRRIVELSRNRELVQSVERVQTRIHFVRWIDIQHGGRTHTQNEHLKIVRAIRRRDPERAERLVREHISRRIDQIGEVIRASYAEIYTGNSLARESRSGADE